MDSQQQVIEAERAAQPWWRIAWTVCLVQLVLAAVVLVMVVVTMFRGDPLLSDRHGFTVLGAGVVTPFAAAAVIVAAVAVVLIARRSTAGLIILTGYGVLIAVLIGQWILMLFNDNAKASTPMRALSIVVFLAAVAAAIAGAAALGRSMRVNRARRAIGLRNY